MAPRSSRSPRSRSTGRRATPTLALLLAAVALTACGGADSYDSPSSGGGGGGGGGGGTGDWSGVGTFRGLTGPGQMTGWLSFDALPGLKLRVRTSTSTQGRYILDMQNDYVERIYLSWNLTPFETSKTDRRGGIASGNDYSSSFSLPGYYASVYVLIGKVRFGTDSGPYYKTVPGMASGKMHVQDLPPESLTVRDPLAAREVTDPDEAARRIRQEQAQERTIGDTDAP